MESCTICGNEIVIRRVNGRLIPIHVNGSCYSSISKNSPLCQFDSHDSYINSNAICPVCGTPVFFYSNAYGSAVYFDDVGWPWPKHECTDTGPSLNSKKALTLGILKGLSLKDLKSNLMSIFRITRIIKSMEGNIVIRVKNVGKEQRLVLGIRMGILESGNLTIPDLFQAPAIILRTDDIRKAKVKFRFISGRLKKISSVLAEQLSAEDWI